MTDSIWDDIPGGFIVIWIAIALFHLLIIGFVVWVVFKLLQHFGII